MHFAVDHRELFLLMLSGQEVGTEAAQQALRPMGRLIAALLQEAQRDLSTQKADETSSGSQLAAFSTYPLGLLADVIVNILNRTARWWFKQQDAASSQEQSSQQLTPLVEEMSTFIRKFIIAGLAESLAP